MSPPTFNIIYQVHDRLVDYDENLQPVPSLAESWEFSPDHKQLTMKLRQGVKFHSNVSSPAPTFLRTSTTPPIPRPASAICPS